MAYLSQIFEVFECRRSEEQVSSQATLTPFELQMYQTNTILI